MTKKACSFPHKQKLSKAQAYAAVRALSAGRRHLPGGVHAYRCPAGGHWHTGHRVRINRKRRQW